MNCLHLCNDLLGSKVHKNLYNHLGNLNLQQTIFFASRKNISEKDQKFINSLLGEVIVSKPIKTFHRVFFKRKIKFLYNNLKTRTDFSKFDIVHASTLYSDGAIALKIFEEFGIPYVVAIRGTDVNLFLRARKDLNPLVKKILLNASKLVFISYSLENNFFRKRYIQTLRSGIQQKCQIIHNGIDEYWLNHIEPIRKITPYKILYIGKFNKNKNVLNLISAFLILKKSIPSLELNLVGNGGNQESEIIKLSNLHKEYIHYHGPVYSLEELRKIIYKNHIFAMASLGETFGLVYVESLTQGLPILYTQNQGIDGTFKENVGTSVIPTSIDSIYEGLYEIINNYSEYELDKIDFQKFSWQYISSIYFNLYKTIIN